MAYIARRAEPQAVAGEFDGTRVWVHRAKKKQPAWGELAEPAVAFGIRASAHHRTS
jgi:hypothetical protein